MFEASGQPRRFYMAPSAAREPVVAFVTACGGIVVEATTPGTRGIIHLLGNDQQAPQINPWCKVVSVAQLLDCATADATMQICERPPRVGGVSAVASPLATALWEAAVAALSAEQRAAAADYVMNFIPPLADWFPWRFANAGGYVRTQALTDPRQN